MGHRTRVTEWVERGIRGHIFLFRGKGGRREEEDVGKGCGSIVPFGPFFRCCFDRLRQLTERCYFLFYRSDLLERLLLISVSETGGICFSSQSHKNHHAPESVCVCVCV